MKTLLQKFDESTEEVNLGAGLVGGTAIIQRGTDYFVFQGYLGGFAHTALFTQCAAPLMLGTAEPEPAPKPARKFMGQKPKDE